MIKTIPTIEELLDKVILSEEEIGKIVLRQAKKIAFFIHKNNIHSIVAVVVLKGAMYFATKLLPAIRRELSEIDSQYQLLIIEDNLIASRYGDNTRAIRGAKIIKDLEQNVSGRVVLVIEDIADECLTLRKIIHHIKGLGAALIMVAVLIKRDNKRRVGHTPRWIGYKLKGSNWVFGFGLDYCNMFRENPIIGIVKPKYCSDAAVKQIKALRKAAQN